MSHIVSDTYTQDAGVPQGSILSVTLFSVKINSIVDSLTPNTECSLFVDDYSIGYSAKNMFTIERQLQQSLNSLSSWADRNGFKFSTTKTVCLHFCQKRKHHLDPQLTLRGQPIPVVEQTKFLGMIFDKRLSFLPHIKNLKLKAQKSLNLLKVVASKHWGGESSVLLQLYRALVRSKLDYGSIVYGSARKSYIKMLDSVQNQALRCVLERLDPPL